MHYRTSGKQQNETTTKQQRENDRKATKRNSNEEKISTFHIEHNPKI